MQEYSIPIDTERDILNIADAIRDLIENGNLTSYIENSHLTESEIYDMLNILENYSMTLG